LDLSVNHRQVCRCLAIIAVALDDTPANQQIDYRIPNRIPNRISNLFTVCAIFLQVGCDLASGFVDFRALLIGQQVAENEQGMKYPAASARKSFRDFDAELIEHFENGIPNFISGCACLPQFKCLFGDSNSLFIG
jgi:hypothetical protein